MPKNKIEDLRNHLFATLEALQDKEDPMDLERAKAVVNVASALIEIQKVENDYIKVTGKDKGTGFIPDEIPTIPIAEGTLRISNK
jgi:hypothetical protein